MKEHTYEDLADLTLGELEEIKEDKMNDLCAIKKEKAVLISNILSLQGMAKEERKRTQEWENVKQAKEEVKDEKDNIIDISDISNTSVSGS
jgi:hypothetical protein